MNIGVVTLFPELFTEFTRVGLIGRAIEKNTLSLVLENLRDHGLGVHRAVDDTPYGGGAGMVLRVDVVVAAVEALETRLGSRAHRVLLTPAGRRLEQRVAHELKQRENLLLICGRYEGFDHRVTEFVDEEVSLGDFVLNGGEVAAMAVIETVARLIPGVLGNRESAGEDSFGISGETLLEYPQYTRPLEYRGQTVPEVLRGGDHQKIRKWRIEQAALTTQGRRPDLGASPMKKSGTQ